ncbi:MAG: hypothetical protein ACR2K4_07555 [Candidatus Limnocylindria bacterium]
MGVPRLAVQGSVGCLAVISMEVVEQRLHGDTIKVNIDGEVFPVRYIGIGSPEVGLPHPAEATFVNEQFLAGGTATRPPSA